MTQKDDVEKVKQVADSLPRMDSPAGVDPIPYPWNVAPVVDPPKHEFHGEPKSPFLCSACRNLDTHICHAIATMDCICDSTVVHNNPDCPYAAPHEYRLRGHDFGSISEDIEKRYPAHKYESISGTNYCKHCSAPQFANIHDSSADFVPKGYETEGDIVEKSYPDPLEGQGLTTEEWKEAMGNPGVVSGASLEDLCSALQNIPPKSGLIMDLEEYNAVEPPHYRRGVEIAYARCNTYGEPTEVLRNTFQRDGKLWITVECIDVFREIKDSRLATAFKYIWRVAFGGKSEPHDNRPQHEIDTRDIKSAEWYLADYRKTMPVPLADSPVAEYNGPLEATDARSQVQKEFDADASLRSQ